MCDKVSIIIPAYNASNYLSQAIDSALAQTYANVEVIVVNDGSKDDGATERVALSYGDRIRYFYKENGGSSSAINTGIRNMTGEWFSWLSHDDLYTPDKIEKQMRFLEELKISEDEKSNHVFFSASDLIDSQGSVIRAADLRKAERLTQKVDAFENNAYLIAEPTEYCFHGCSCLVHKDVFEKIGVFDESLRLLNDLDMWFRIYAYGFTVHFIPMSLVKGRIHKEQVSRSIGFSYHNPEQDMFWSRSFEWLRENHSQNFKLFFLCGRHAYLKTRKTDGDAACLYALTLEPSKRILLFFKKTVYCASSKIRTLIKSLYLKLRM